VVHQILIAPILALVFGLIEVRWTTPENRSITIEAPERAEEVVDCLESSLQARIRFEIRVCRKRSGWLDYCEDARSELHTAQFDEVTESYRVTTDRWGDDLEPTAEGIPARTDAVRMLHTLQDLPLSFLIESEPEILSNPKAYLQVRTVFVCRGGSSRTLAHLSRIVTLGIVNNLEERSDWRDFALGR
jgi:hypothetical protein